MPSIQLAHAGRKASHVEPWNGSGLIQPDLGGWEVVAPSPIPYDEDYGSPHELSIDEIDRIVDAFDEAARRSYEAGFEVVECHFAHGYLAHEFLSPISNHRDDEYGGSLENRARFALSVVEEVRAMTPDRLQMLVRISASDYVEGGWDLE